MTAVVVVAAVLAAILVIAGGVAYGVHRSRLMLGYINREDGLCVCVAGPGRLLCALTRGVTVTRRRRVSIRRTTGCRVVSRCCRWSR